MMADALGSLDHTSGTTGIYIFFGVLMSILKLGVV